MSSVRGNKKVPAIRFAGFGGDWEYDFLGSNAGFAKGQGYSKSDLVETGRPIILYGRLYTKYQTVISDIDTFVKEKENSLLSTGCEVIVPASGETPEDIAIASAVLEKEVVLGGDLNIIYPNHKIKAIFLALSLSNGKPKKEITKRAQGKSVVHVRNSDLSQVTIHFPKPKEQTKIGNYFQQLDTLIAQHQQKHEKLQNIKKALLEKCFPKQGEHTPELRFKGFSGAWEEKALGDVCDYKNGKGHEDVQKNNGKYELINLNSISINGGLKHSGKFIDESDSTLNKNDLVMILSDVAHGNLLGRTALIPSNNKYVLNQRVALLRPIEKSIPLYIFYNINAYQPYFKSQGAGMSQLNISRNSVESFILKMPNIEEQTKIGNLFQQLDTLINQQQTQLVKLKNMKQACLEKMFV
ncbi:MAG: restriction endonuclease subunit S [Methylophaga sp.]|nr:restriction endonuclease subunit S [Methylophaga sp.]